MTAIAPSLSGAHAICLSWWAARTVSRIKFEGTNNQYLHTRDDESSAGAVDDASERSAPPPWSVKLKPRRSFMTTTTTCRASYMEVQHVLQLGTTEFLSTISLHFRSTPASSTDPQI